MLCWKIPPLLVGALRTPRLESLAKGRARGAGVKRVHAFISFQAAPVVGVAKWMWC